jgi:hypothetical protein
MKRTLAALALTTMVSGCAQKYITIDRGAGSPKETLRADSSLFRMTITCPDSTGWTRDNIDNVAKYLTGAAGGIYVYRSPADTPGIPPGPHRLRYDCRVTRRQ